LVHEQLYEFLHDECFVELNVVVNYDVVVKAKVKVKVNYDVVAKVMAKARHDELLHVP